MFYFRTQPVTEVNGDAPKTAKKVSVSEKIIEPEKTFMDSFITEDIDGRKLSITRQVSSRIVERIIYSDLVIIKHIG